MGFFPQPPETMNVTKSTYKEVLSSAYHCWTMMYRTCVNLRSHFLFRSVYWRCPFSSHLMILLTIATINGRALNPYGSLRIQEYERVWHLSCKISPIHDNCPVRVLFIQSLISWGSAFSEISASQFWIFSIISQVPKKQSQTNIATGRSIVIQNVIQNS